MKIKNFKHIFKFQAIVVIFIAFFEIFVIFSQFLKKIHEFVGKIYIYLKYLLQNGENLPQKKFS